MIVHIRIAESFKLHILFYMIGPFPFFFDASESGKIPIPPADRRTLLLVQNHL